MSKFTIKKFNTQKNVSVVRNRRAARAQARVHMGGFTLVEMLVAIGLFSVVMVVAVSAILSVISNNKKSQGINNVVNNLNFSIESMVRDMKTGYLYKCPAANGVYSSGWPISKSTINEANADLCTGTGTHDTVAFFSTLNNSGAEPVEYKFIAPETVDGVYTPGHIVKRKTVGGYIDLTSQSDVDIQSMKMYINSPVPGTGAQPSIFLIVTGKARISDSEVTDFGLQTFISQRILNL